MNTSTVETPLLTQGEIQRRIAALKRRKDEVELRIKAIKNSHWYAIKGLPEQRARDLREAAETFCVICAALSNLYEMEKPLHLRLQTTKQGSYE